MAFWLLRRLYGLTEAGASTTWYVLTYLALRKIWPKLYYN